MEVVKSEISTSTKSCLLKLAAAVPTLARKQCLDTEVRGWAGEWHPFLSLQLQAPRDETSSAEQALVARMQENHRSQPPVSAAPPARPSVPSPSGAGVGTTVQPLAVLGDCMVGLGLVVLIFGPELFVKKNVRRTKGKILFSC